MRKEPELAEAYKKDAATERFLAKLNEILAVHQDQEYKDFPECYPTLHIIGAPRSGTTLALQLVCAHLSVGYVNNLIAAFWRAPLFGIRLSRKFFGDSRPSTYESQFGRTSHVLEPHEFGYFWSTLLNYDDMSQKETRHEDSIDWARLRLILLNMTNEFGMAVAFKSFLLGWHIQSIQQVLPRTCFLWVRRQPLDTALSILKTREQYLGDIRNWVSLKPKGCERYESSSPLQQVAAQVYFVEQTISEQVRRVASRNVLELDYDELCGAPGEALRQIRELLDQNGAATRRISEPPRRFERKSERSTPELIAQMTEAVEYFYGRQGNAA